MFRKHQMSGLFLNIIIIVSLIILMYNLIGFDMLSVKGVFDGEVVRPIEKLNFRNKRNVIITFIDEDNDEELSEIRKMTLNSSGFEFWNDEEEDLYGEYLDDK